MTVPLFVNRILFNIYKEYNKYKAFGDMSFKMRIGQIE